MLQLEGEQVVLRGIEHRYRSVVALTEVSLSVREGEFMTLLGPSGCGKTTLLRVIAGFERPRKGSVHLGRREITTVPPHRRPVNMVFQHPALFPHLDVFENVAFGLRLGGVSRQELNKRVGEALALVRLEGLERRGSQELSGGQMQRVALARALVKRPLVLLLDEPLGALDLKIRLEMEVELRRLHRETGTTFVYVTHDQREALALADRTAVLNAGRLEQVGTPEEIYRAPASPFVASFVGDANVIPVEFVRTTGGLALAVGEGLVPFGATADGVTAAGTWLVVRPELVRLKPRDTSEAQELWGVVRDSAFRGTGFSYRVQVRGLASMLKAEILDERKGPFPIGSEVAISWPEESVALLPRDDSPQERTDLVNSQPSSSIDKNPGVASREGP